MKDVIICERCGESANAKVEKENQSGIIRFTNNNDAVVELEDGNIKLDVTKYEQSNDDKQYPMLKCNHCGNKDTVIPPSWDDSREKPLVEYIKKSTEFKVGEGLLTKIRRKLY